MAALVMIVLGIFGMIRHLVSDSLKPVISSGQQQISRATARRSPAVTPPQNQAQDSEHPAVSDAMLTMRRQLREFIIPHSGIAGLTAPQALAKLQEHWETLPRETDAVPSVEFSLSPESTRQLELEDNPPFVSLPIPNVSLLTNLRLLAAQADLKVEVVKTGAILTPAEVRPGSGGQLPGTPLSGGMLDRFKDVLNTENENRFTTSEGVKVTITSLRNGIKEWSAADPGAAETPLFQNDSINTGDTKSTGGTTDNNNGGSSSTAENADTSTDADETSISPAEAQVSDQEISGTIDLNLEAEFIEFEGFINYESPIQITANNALGQSEPMVLTDSGITQPVFATRMLPDPRRQALARMLGAMGLPDRTNIPTGLAEPFVDTGNTDNIEVKALFRRALGFLELGQYNLAGEQFTKLRTMELTNPEFLKQLDRAEDNLQKILNDHSAHSGKFVVEQSLAVTKDILGRGENLPNGYNWDENAGILAATDDSGRTGRILTWVAAAIQESVSLGALLEFSSAADWQDGKAPAAPSTKPSPPPGANHFGISANQKAGAFRSAPVRLTVRSGNSSMTSTQVELPASRSFSLLSLNGKNCSVQIKAEGAGFQVQVMLDIPGTPDYAAAKPTALAPSQKIDAGEFMLPGPRWNRLDYPISGSRHSGDRLSLFVRLTRTTIASD